MRLNIYQILKEEELWPNIKPLSILDVGCGISLQSKHFDIPTRLAVDVYKTYLRHIDASVPYIPLCVDAAYLDRIFIPSSVDVVLLADVIEHLEKDRSQILLKTAETIARMCVVVTTPSGYHPQDIDIWELGGDTHQTHRCGWTADELTKLGYSVAERPYTMSDIPRCTAKEVDPNITMLYAVKRV